MKGKKVLFRPLPGGEEGACFLECKEKFKRISFKGKAEEEGFPHTPKDQGSEERGQSSF